MVKRRSTALRALIGGVVGSALVAAVGVTLAVAPSANAAAGIASNIHGVNWADPRDNFQSGNIVPSSLSATDNYATTYAKATAIARGFQAFGTNTIRFGINEYTANSSWWNSYLAAFDATAALGMNVMISPWPPPGGPNRVTNTTAFYAMWDKVINKYGNNSRFYFDIYNEPSGYSTSALIDFCAAWLARYPSIPRDHVVVPGTGNDADVTQMGASSRLTGTLLGLHMYSVYGLSFPTEQAWINYIKSKVGPYGNRVVFSEFKVATTNGVNYNGARDGDNHRSYLWAITDTARELGMGTLLWPGLMTGNAYSLTRVSGSGSNLTVTVNNQTVVDRLHYAWGSGTTTPTTPTTTPGSTGPTPPSGSTFGLRNGNSGRCLDVTGGSSTDGTAVEIWDCTGGNAQRFTTTAAGELRTPGGKCLDVISASTADGARINIWTCNGAGNQKFRIDANGTVVATQSGKCLDVVGGGTANGALAEIWTCNGGANQRWSRV